MITRKNCSLNRRYCPRYKQSECAILDARQITQEPLARIKMPRRIPHGLHGSWLVAR
ncbi:carotenoid oxygenase family protein [Legionella lytica]|uniref:Carotenoid oxygenase family protein n=1 Tax=Legionella lytica TaxID=96232 RepID=A0ABW8D4V5_9GAMM